MVLLVIGIRVFPTPKIEPGPPEYVNKFCASGDATFPILVSSKFVNLLLVTPSGDIVRR